MWVDTTNLTKEKTELDWTELHESVLRITALIKIYDRSCELTRNVLFWDSKVYTIAWMLFLTVWFLWLPEHSLSILLLLTTYYMIKYHSRSRARQFEGKSVMYEMLEFSPRAEMDEDVTIKDDDKFNMKDEDTPARMIYENERRWPFTQFDAQYLLTDLDFPHFMDKLTNFATSAPKELMIDRDGVYTYRWEVEVTPETDENGWQYAANVTSSQWRSVYSSFDCFFRRRLHRGYRLSKQDDHAEEEEEQPPARKMYLLPHSANASQTFMATKNESGTSEQDIIQQHTALYCKIRNDVEITIRLVEKYKNLFTGRLQWLTTAVKVVLILSTLLSLFIPTRIVVWYFVIDYFRWGWTMGKLRRANLNEFINRLMLEERRLSVSSRIPATVTWDPNTNLDECKFAPLHLRNWINRTFKLKLSLKQIAACRTLHELADLVVTWSVVFVKVLPRERSNPWSKSFDNLLDHVPSDLCRFQVDNAAYS